MEKETVQMIRENFEYFNVEKIANKIDEKKLINILKEKIDETEFTRHLNYVTKDQINAFLALNDKKLKKDKLVEIALEKIYGNEFLMIKFYTEFKDIFALKPTEIEQVLDCTSIERKRWTEDKLLKVVEYRSFEKYGKTIEYPVFDRIHIYSIIKETLESWRAEYKEIKNKNKVEGAKKSTGTRRINENIRTEFKKEFKKSLVSWYKEDGKLGASFELAYWTVWVSRWAKENQEKAYNAIKNEEKYLKQKEYLYELKNNSISLLLKSEYANQSFYRPINPNKESLILCQEHYEKWKRLREGIYMDKWSFFHSSEDEIHKCPSCSYDCDDDYYSLFHVEIKNERIKDYKFSFHTPYQLGVSVFKDHNELPKVDHIENQEGMFRFGRSVFEQEKVIYREKDVIKKFQEAMEKYKMYYLQ